MRPNSSNRPHTNRFAALLSRTLVLLVCAFPLAFAADQNADEKKKKPAPTAAPAKPAPQPQRPAPPPSAPQRSAPAAQPARQTPPSVVRPQQPTPGNRPAYTSPVPAGRPSTVLRTNPPSANPAANAGRGFGTASLPSGNHAVRATNGTDVRLRGNGQRAEIVSPSRGIAVQHGLAGGRRVLVERPDHSRVFVERRGQGYVQSVYAHNGREFAHRTYVVNGQSYDRFYRPYSYRGIYLNTYSPVLYYPTGFYGWAYNPWMSPAPYAWGFAGSPWYAYYGGYFRPEPMYPNASLWLADYMFSNSLMSAYQAGAPPMPDSQVAVSPEVKRLVADEVRWQIALENSEAQANATSQEIDPGSSGIVRMLDGDASHVFVAGRDFDFVGTGGAECAVSAGDVLQLQGRPDQEATAARLIVLSGKGGSECANGSGVSVPLADLQEMQNHMRETIGQGMGELQKQQGKGGLPAAPPSATGAPVKAAFAELAPPPDPTADAQLSQQFQAADQLERETAVESQSGGPTVSPVQPKEISLGQTQDEVTAILGNPLRVANLGEKKALFYKDMKVLLIDGKVVDVQ